MSSRGTTTELLKLRRTRIVALGTAISLVIVLFACMNLFSGDAAEDFTAEPSNSWSMHLIGYYMILSFLGPTQLALLASRSVDAEHLGSGWRLNALAGIQPGTVVLRKLLVLAPLIVATRCVECAVVVTIPLLLGAPSPTWSYWIACIVATSGISTAMLAILLWLAAQIESQLVVVGIGVVGGFLGVASLLSPPWLAALNPFGYLAFVIPFRNTESGVTPTDPNWLLWGAYLAAAALCSIHFARSLNRKEV